MDNRTNGCMCPTVPKGKKGNALKAEGNVKEVTSKKKETEKIDHSCR